MLEIAVFMLSPTFFCAIFVQKNGKDCTLLSYNAKLQKIRFTIHLKYDTMVAVLFY